MSIPIHEWLVALQTGIAAHPTLTLVLALVGAGLVRAWLRYQETRRPRGARGAWRDRSTPL